MSTFSFESVAQATAPAPAPPTGNTFSFEDAQKPKSDDRPSMIPDPDGGMAFGDIAGQEAETLAKQSLPATLMKVKSNLDREIDARNTLFVVDEHTGKSAVDEERERRIKAGDKKPFNAVEWATLKGKEMVHGKRPEAISISEELVKMKDQAVADPINFGKSFFDGLAAHPEYWGPWAFVLVPVESGLEQESETGYVDPKKVLMDTGMMATPATVLHGALHIGQLRAAKAKAATPTPEIEVKAAEDIAKKIDEGTHPMDAVDQVLKAMGTPDAERVKIVADANEVIVKDHQEKAHAAEEGKVAEDDQSQHQRTDAPREPEAKPQADRGDSAAPSAKEPTKEEEARLKERGLPPRPNPLSGMTIEQAETQVLGPERAARFRQLTQKTQEGKITSTEAADWQRLNNQLTKGLAELRKKGEEEKVVPVAFTPLPKGLEKRMVTPEETFRVLVEAGIDEEAARGMAGTVPIAIGALRQRLTKFMGGQKYADSVLSDVLLRDGKQSGKIKPELMVAMAAVGIGAAGAYALSEDKSQAIKIAMAIGATMAAAATAGRVGASVLSIFREAKGDTSIKPMGPFNEYLKRPQMVEHAVAHWERSTDALLEGVPDKNASRTKVRDWIQGHRDVELSPQEQAYANEVKKFLDGLGNMAHDADVIKQLRENYLTGLYQKKPFKSWKDIMQELTTDEAFRGNYTGMGRNSRFNLQKVIPDYRTAERLHAEGKFPLIPLTNDPVKIAAHYARSVQKTIAVRKLITDLKNTASNRYYEATGIPVPVIISMAMDDAQGRIVKSNREMQKRLDIPEEARQMMDKRAVLDARGDYVMVRHPSLNGLLVHKDVAPMLKMLFDTSDPSMIHRALYATSMAGKALFFTASLFHPVALGVVATTLALPRLRPLIQMPRYWKEIPAARKMLKNSEYAPQIEVASEAGLEFMRAPQDMDPHIISRVLKYAENELGPAGLPLKGLRHVNDWVQHMLWNELFPTLKLASFNAELQGALRKDLKTDPKTVAHQIAKGVNDMFGGQNWFHLANDVPEGYTRRLAQALFSPYGRRVQQIAFLSPDWNISAMRTWYEGIKSVVPGVSRKASDSMYRSYLVWSGLTYLGAANFLSNHYTGHNIWEQKDWTYIDLGDGTKIQINKHWMEFMHLLQDPQKFFLNKLNLMPREAIEQFFGKEWVSYDEAKGVYGPPMKHYPFGLTRPVHAAKTFIPLSIANIIRDPGAGISGMLSFGIYGTPYKEREEQAAERSSDPEMIDAKVRSAKQRAKDAGKSYSEIEAAGERARSRATDEEAARKRSRKLSEKQEKGKYRSADDDFVVHDSQ